MFEAGDELYDFRFAEDAPEQLSALTSLEESFCDVVVMDGQAIVVVKNPESFVRATAQVDNPDADRLMRSFGEMLCRMAGSTEHGGKPEAGAQ